MEDKINQSETNRTEPKKRLLFVITQSEFGGAQRFLSQLIPHLKSDDFELAIVSGADGNKEMREMLPQNVRYITAKHLRRNPNVFNDIASLFELRSTIKDFKPDILFLNSSKAGFNGSWATKLLPIAFPHPKIIYRIGGWTFNDPWPWWKRLGYRWLEKVSARWKDYIIVNNKYDYDQAIKFGIKPREKLVLIYNGIDPYKLDFLEKDEAEIKLYEKLPSNQKRGNFFREGLIIGTIANFYPTKGLQYLIGAFSTLNAQRSTLNASLVIIGDGPERKKIELQIKDAELQNSVFLTGRIPDAHRYLKVFDIFVLPSVKEGFPWALLEAMSAKLPVIATVVGANPEIIEHEKNGLLVPPADSTAIAEAISKLAENEALRQELGIQAHQTVIHKFDLNRMIAQVETLL